jgi:hypothetical protein
VSQFPERPSLGGQKEERPNREKPRLEQKQDRGTPLKLNRYGHTISKSIVSIAHYNNPLESALEEVRLSWGLDHLTY